MSTCTRRSRQQRVQFHLGTGFQPVVGCLAGRIIDSRIYLYEKHSSAGPVISLCRPPEHARPTDCQSQKKRAGPPALTSFAALSSLKLRLNSFVSAHDLSRAVFFADNASRVFSSSCAAPERKVTRPIFQRRITSHARWFLEQNTARAKLIAGRDQNHLSKFMWHETKNRPQQERTSTPKLASTKVSTPHGHHISV